ncbi:CLUMA_CG021644, isoform A [Clunio marinus]|uniref:CLUMA_CG021644, isoform A n=1 Tax=Clunio marinus TaxID=568069 RepID=A0A1J1JAB8_9DIPT|nr:CLUMA_CG021644, isoform A [Clunio marinus]
MTLKKSTVINRIQAYNLDEIIQLECEDDAIMISFAYYPYFLNFCKHFEKHLASDCQTMAKTKLCKY